MIRIVKKPIGFHCLLMDTQLIFFGIEYITKEVSSKIRDKSIAHDIFRTQDNESIMCGFYCIAFIEYMLAGKAFLHYTNLFIRIIIKTMAK